jgi:agmatine/peptidylarginine deiminase
MFGEAGEVLVEGLGGNDRDADVVRARDIDTLRSSVDSRGASLRVNLVAPPRERLWAEKTALFAPTYLNAYVANAAVIAAKFGDEERDESARQAGGVSWPAGSNDWDQLHRCGKRGTSLSNSAIAISNVSVGESAPHLVAPRLWRM